MRGHLGEGSRQDTGVPQLHDVAARLGEFQDPHARVAPARSGQHQIVPATQHELKGRRLLARGLLTVAALVSEDAKA